LDIAFPGFPLAPRGFSRLGGVFHTPSETADVDIAPPHTDTTVVGASGIPPGRSSAFPGIKSASDLAQRFNIFDHHALREAHKHLRGVDPLRVVTSRDYSGGMGQLALHRAAPVHPALNQISRSIRESAPPGSTWLTDISHPHELDFDGNIYGRLFAEETTAYAREYFSSDKSCASLVLHLTQLQSWILKHVPGGKLVLLRCDFGSEYAKQGHGDDILTRALSAFCDANPGLRVYPVAPRAQMHNAVELVVQKVMGHAFMNAIRACVGGPICGFLHRGGCFQHNHRISHSQ